MTIWTQRTVRRGGYLEDYGSGFGAYLGAGMAEEFVRSPIPSLVRSGRLRAAEEGQLNFPTRAALTALGTVYPPAAAYNVAEAPGLPGFFRDEPDSSVVDAEAARSRIKEEGLDLTVPDTGIRSRALDILIERKKEERRRNDIINRGPSGFLAGAAAFTTRLGVAALDPLNIASAFVPVVSQARYTSMLAQAGSRLGRAGVRARIGAVEGAAGAALVEPLIYGAASQEQADYGLADSLLNIGLGTALGGGLHVGAGVVGDWRTAKAPKDAPLPKLLESVDAGTREQALRTSVAQAAEGRLVDVEPIISYAPQRMEEPLRASVGPAEVIEPRVDPTIGVEGFTVYHGSPHTFEKFSMENIGTGEGAQAYGHGLYFAESRDVSESYQKALSGGVRSPAREQAEAFYKAASGDRALALREAKEVYEELKAFGASPQEEVAMEGAIELLESADPIISGALYEVRIRANPDDFLDWDKPLSEQPQVLAKLEAISMEEVNFRKEASELTGQNVHDLVNSYLSANYIPPDEGIGRKYSRPESVAREALAAAGIPGIKYLDAGSRAAGDGSRNFVVFDDSLITTVRRNDELLLKQPENLQARVSAQFNPENIRLYDGEAVRIADERMAAAPKDEDMPETSLAEIMEDVQRITLTLDDPELVTREMADFDALAKTADEYGKAVRAAADCRLSRGA